MSTDRELLEKAAKAAELNWRDWTPHRFLGEPELREWPFEWNPLTDDGDALRLAVKLNLWEAIRLAHRMVGGPGAEDLYAATRRAVVRAAAALATPPKGGAAMSDEQSRKAFWNWYARETFFGRDVAFAAWQESRRVALEEAAKLCDLEAEGWEFLHNTQAQIGADQCSTAIRALASKTQEG